VIGETISHYKILSRLGEGGMGVVYEAEDTRLGRKVAIKLLPDGSHADAEAVQRFFREARVVSNLNHPHICTLYDIGAHHPSTSSGQGDRQFMVMELLDGQSLKDRIASGPLSLDHVLELGAEMADALDAAHAQGVVHRDIKPANLFVTRRGNLKVLDFGIAKLGQSSRGDAETRSISGQLTTMGTTIGTVSYMSPEQARGQDIDARSDVFSAGVVLYEMATGRLPFQGATVATIFESLLTKPPAAPSSIRAVLPAEFDHIVLKALEKDRETRYQSAAELKADLKRLKRTTDSSQVVAATGGAAAARASRRWRVPLLVGTPLVTAALVGGLLFYRSINTPALTERDPVVLAMVVNRTGDTMFDDTLGEALAMQLRQSPFLNVVPDQQVAATLRQMGREPMTAITEDVGREVCQRAGARALLGGTIAMLGSSYVITLGAQDCVTAAVVAEEQGQSPSKEQVLAVLGATVSRFREELGESLSSVQRYDAKIEEGTTRSLEALKSYSQGIRTRRISGDFDSVPFFRRAIELDPEFALAFARLGTVYSNLGQQDEARKMTTRAYELRQKVSESERLYIEARYYTTVEPDLQKALDAYRLTLATYPNDYTALTNSSTLHRQLGDVDEAVRKSELVTKVAPDQPLGWVNLAGAYLDRGDYASARRAAEAAVALQDSSGARQVLHTVGIVTGDQALADAQVAAMRGRREEVDLIASRMFGAAYRGRMNEAAELAVEVQARAVAQSRGPQAGQALMTLAISEAIVGRTDRAQARVAAADDDGLVGEQSIDERLVVAAILEDAKGAAAALPAALAANAKNAGADPARNAAFTRLLQALPPMAAGKPAEAVAAAEPVTFSARDVSVVSILSLAKLRAGDLAGAAKGLTFVISVPINQPTAGPAFAHATLARIHAQLGNKDEARKLYQKFFEMWKDADPDVPLLVQARAEFAKL
jgi:tetratricopeptide (TPR) repeat protein